MNNKLKKWLYFGAVIVLFLLGIVFWLRDTGSTEKQEFIVDGVHESIFEFKSSLDNPQRIKISFKGELDCDAILTLKTSGTNIRFRQTFPIYKDKFKNLELECRWNYKDIVMEFNAKECIVNDLKIELELFDK